ncbi:MAG TPA: hypothetical protein VHQ90_06225 [Thermoanaerobaculia bacterium]|nr:hypothetical protein [Thermoanaerobaculia bacterium]
MIRKTSIGLLAAMLAAGAAGALSAQTAEELIEKNIQAKGGREKLKAVKTVRVTGKMVGQMGEFPVSMEMLPPAHKVRFDFVVQGMTGTSAYDGQGGWQVMPFLGKTDPEPMSAEDLKEAKEEADFLGPLFDYKDKGNQVELLGKGDLEGTPVYKLKLTEKSGDVSTIYLDAETYLELKEESSKTMRGQVVELERTFGDYKKVDGLTFPFTMETKSKGQQAAQTLSITKLELNVDVAASRFDMPKVQKKKEETAPPPKPN